MIVYGVYIITDDGRTILAENFQSTENLPNEVLLGGVLTALQHMASEMTRSHSEMKRVVVEGLTYHIRSYGLIRVVLITDAPRSPEGVLIEAMFQQLGMQFIKKYGDILADIDYNLNVFEPFRTTIREIITQDSVSDESGSIQPSKKLTTGEVFSLPHELHSTALALISLESATAEEIAKEIGIDIDLTLKNLLALQNRGFIGKKQEKGSILYFCSI